MSCPTCKAEIELKGVSRPIAAELGPLLGLKKAVESQAMVNAKEQGILGDERLSDPADFYYGRPQAFANHRCSFYLCHGCKRPYFGGLIDCEQEMNNAEHAKTSPEDLLCKDCVLKELGAGRDICETHGKTQIDWKCIYCCSVAVFHCFGTHYMCNRCHTGWNGNGPEPRDCHGVDCPLGIAHPPASRNPREASFALGCGICRSEKKAVFKSTAVKQVFTAAQAPAAFVHDARRKMKGVEYPEVEHEWPEVLTQAEADLEATLLEEYNAKIAREAAEAELEAKKAALRKLPPLKLHRVQRYQQAS